MEPTEQPVHDFTTANSGNFANFKLTEKIILLFFGVAILGILTGFGLFKNSSSSISSQTTAANLSNVSKGTVVGSNDTKTFKDTAEGIVKEGGIDGEGTFHLVRPGGESQNVYLTSSNVDLKALIDRKIKVWGQTIQAQHAGWLMDVGRVEVLE